MRQSLVSLLCIGLLLLWSCSKKSDPAANIPLKADAGPDQTAAPFTTVTLDGSASTGPGTILYEWTYNGSVPETEINFQNKTSAKPTFIPTKNGSYFFHLNVTQGSQFSTDDVTITVSGFLSISGTLTDNLVLKDIEPDPSKPDYKVTADLIIPAGKAVTVGTPGTYVVLEAADNIGIEIQGGSISSQGSTISFTSATSWKGILLSSGSLTLGSSICYIQKAGKSTFTGQTETAAVTVTGGTLSMGSTLFSGTTGYDLLISGVSAGSTVAGNQFNSTKPIKMPIASLSSLGFNTYSASGSYDYITLTTPGAGVTVGASNNFAFQPGSSPVKYLIDGDFTAGSPIVFGNATIYMKAGAGIVASAGLTANSATFDGLASAPWKGIAIGGSTTVSIFNSFIKNAGSAVFNTGSFITSTKAAVYYFASNNGVLQNTEISDSQGYGVYMGSANYITLTGSTIKNSTFAGVSTLVTSLPTIIGVNNTFTMNANVPAIEVQSFSTSTQPGGIWPSLGGTNYYQFISHVFKLNSGIWTLSPGVNLKFKSGKQVDIAAGTLSAIGTLANPITFDSDAGTAGSWGGIVLESLYNMEFCNIKNGGQSTIFVNQGVTPATELANVVFNYGGVASTNTFKNNNISGSTGYGCLIESGKQDPQPLLAGNANTFTSNTLGTSIKKP